jgi:hypothetical protein
MLTFYLKKGETVKKKKKISKEEQFTVDFFKAREIGYSYKTTPLTLFHRIKNFDFKFQLIAVTKAMEENIEISHSRSYLDWAIKYQDYLCSFAKSTLEENHEPYKPLKIK